MFVKLLKHWNGYKPGRVFNMPDGAANLLVKRGMAERQTEEPATSKPAAKKQRKR